MVELMMITSMWESISSWFTPTYLFFLTSFIIATIFIASNKHHDHKDSSPLARVSSFIDRARSSYATTESQHHYPPQRSKTTDYTSTSRLAQSIYLSPGYESSNSVEHSPSRVDSVQISDSPSQLARVDSFFDRVKSFKISSVLKSGNKSENDVNRSKSLVEVKKSRSEANMAQNEDEDEDVDLRRPATARESRNEVDTKADDFISRFKGQLKLQRLESLVRFNEMLKRGT